MNPEQSFNFDALPTADLIVDAVYEGGTKGNTSDDPISRLLRGGNQGGFRYVGSPSRGTVKLVILYSSMDDVDWPDSLDEETGLFYYYGDNKRPGHDLHDTQRQGNLILKQVFERAHQGERIHVPPIFIFTKAGKGRDVVFRGLAVPGADSISSTEDLVAVWKSYGGKRFQNYRAIFTVLDVPCISRAWIDGLLSGKPNDGAPSPWLQWIATGITKPLKAARTIDHRRKNEQLPTAAHDETMLATIRKHFEDDPFGFEKFSAELVKLADRNITAIEVTRPTRDGGRDAIGEYRLGIGRDRILLDFALEAKCYGPDNSVGVKETSRLISRLRHRQFGVLVTTSYVAEQAYREIREDKHPIIVIAGGDITKILIENGINTVAALKGMLGSMDTGRRTRALPTVAILAFGSLIAEPGPEIQPLMLMVILFTGRAEPPARPAAVSTNAPPQPNSDRVRDYQDRLRILESRAAQEARADALAQPQAPALTLVRRHAGISPRDITPPTP
jgi:hypothetical protein